MNRLTQLEVKKLMKELEYLSSEFDYKNELVNEADTKFIGTVNDFLEQHPDLKEAFDNTMERRMKDAIDKAKSQVNEDGEFVPEEEIIVEKEVKQSSPKVKKMYREIVKKTHPDKVGEGKLNEIYIEASKHYDDDNLFALYSIFGQLGLDFEVEEEDLGELNSRIEEMRSKIGLLDSTQTWIWYNETDERIRRDMVVGYILSQIR